MELGRAQSSSCMHGHIGTVTISLSTSCRALTHGSARTTAHSRRMAEAQTPQRKFRPVIEATLRRNGGSASVTEVYAAVQREMTLQPGDLAPVDRGEERWKNAVRQEARAMRSDGTLVRSSQRGRWQLA